MPCSLPSSWLRCWATAAMSLSRRPGSTAANAASIAASCSAAVPRMSACSSSDLIALMRSTSSVASANVAFGSARLRRSTKANDSA